ncbi:MAG TPA: endoribonuclease MazF [Candidatus Marinimicrobia bacterium]|nr:endoribonuclease MazF [Candidatus Neomarinimicrobiota bacterium]
MTERYVPDRGDIVWLNFTPQSGHEQAGKRPVIVVSPKKYNQKVGLTLFFPITNKIKGYPFEVHLPDNIQVEGVILSDQIKSLDWRSRNIKFICNINKNYVADTIKRFSVLLKK